MRAAVILGMLCLCAAVAAAPCWGQSVETLGKLVEGSVEPASDPQLTRIESVTIYGAPVGLDDVLHTGTTFTVNGYYSLQVKVLWRRIATGLHVLQIRFTTPEGTVYETTRTPFMVRNRPRQNAAVQLRDVVHPVEVEVARPVPGTGYEVWAELPLAGTWAQRLPGQWKMEVMLDGGSTVYSTSNFTLTPGTS